jgi:alkylation response protein AidB-like acyl-CoA dehydrogenase
MSNIGRSPERQRLLDAAAEIALLLADAAQQAEEIRHLPQRCVDAMQDADLFRCAAPREVGGLELDPLSQTEVFEAVTAAESNAGWNLMISAVWDSLLGSRLPDEGAQAVFGGAAWPITAGMIWPFGKATTASEGYIVTGRWRFGSGIHQASWVASGCTVYDGDTLRPTPPGAPGLIAVVPKGEVAVHDNWRVAGLRGTGSCDYSMEEQPVGDAFVLGNMRPACRGGAWWRLPGHFQAGPGHCGFALGVARRCLDEVKAMGEKRRYGNPAIQAERESIQIALGRHMAEYEAARLYVLDSFARACELAESGDGLPIGKPTGAYATEVAVHCAEFAFKSLGTAALFDDHLVQRYLRDILAAQQHVAAGDVAFARYGAGALGLSLAAQADSLHFVQRIALSRFTNTIV